MTDQTDQIARAFGHPDARATAPDRILLRDHIVSVEIGAFQGERDVAQRLAFNVAVEVAGADTAADDVDRILSYDTLTDAIATELGAERLNLLETLADRVAARILAAPLARRVFLRIEKLDRGSGRLGVEIVRSTAEAEPVAPPQAPPPRILWAPDGTGFAALPDRFDHDAPLILCPTATTQGPRTRDQAAQRRIDLLALDQAAVALAADLGLNVIATRTELDWAQRQRQPSVWAPSKMVLDAVIGPPGQDALSLAVWLAETLEAVELVILDGTAPGIATPVPVRTLHHP